MPFHQCSTRVNMQRAARTSGGSAPPATSRSACRWRLVHHLRLHRVHARLPAHLHPRRPDRRRLRPLARRRGDPHQRGVSLLARKHDDDRLRHRQCWVTVEDECRTVLAVIWLQAMLSILMNASCIGLIFARLSRASNHASQIIFSDKAVVRCVRSGRLHSSSGSPKLRSTTTLRRSRRMCGSTPSCTSAATRRRARSSRWATRTTSSAASSSSRRRRSSPTGSTRGARSRRRRRPPPTTTAPTRTRITSQASFTAKPTARWRRPTSSAAALLARAAREE